LPSRGAFGRSGANHEGGDDASNAKFRRLAEGLLSVALAAARAQMAHFGTGMEVERKPIRPVTVADRQSEEIILAGWRASHRVVRSLPRRKLRPGRSRTSPVPFFLVDPAGRHHRGSSRASLSSPSQLGLIEARAPGVRPLYAPALSDFYVTLATKRGGQRKLEPDRTRAPGRVRLRPLRTRVPIPMRWWH
jgi:3'-phosphoadenosine 5'-phosphosulfate (PAPS) 3'-phosphatase